MDQSYQLTSANFMLAAWIAGGLAAAVIVVILLDSLLKKGSRGHRPAGVRPNFIVAYFKRTRHLQRTLSREMENRRWHKHRNHERDKRL